MADASRRFQPTEPSHVELLIGLADLVESAGYGVTQMDFVGYRRPRQIEGYRPDLIANRLTTRATIIGEAKIIPDLVTARSRRQFSAFSRVLLPTIPVTYAGFVLAVPLAATWHAWRALRHSGAVLAKATVVGQAGGLWLITSLQNRGAGSWHESGLAIRVRKSRCDAAFLRPG